MSAEIVFARHGNTFGPGDKVVWVGRETDAPLVDKGLEQAHAAAAALARSGRIPTAIWHGSLSRTRTFAAIVAEDLGLAVTPRQDDRLDEIDYGAWAGLTQDEIAAQPGGPALLEAWSQRDQWPEAAGWVTTRAGMLAQVTGFARDVLAAAGTGERLLVVSSNGVLRFFPRQLAARPAPGIERASYVMKTGHLGLARRAGEGWDLLAWNDKPESW